MTRSIIIEKAELDFELEKFGYQNKIDKKTMTDMMKLFSRFHLVEVIGQIGEPDCRIRLYPSIQFCLSETEFQRQAQLKAQKLQPRNGKVVEEMEGDEDA